MGQWSKTCNTEIQLIGVVDRSSVPKLWQQAQQWSWEVSSLSIDLNGIKSSDSSAMALLLHLIQHAKKNHCHIMLRSVPDKLLTLFEVSNALLLISDHLDQNIEG